MIGLRGLRGALISAALATGAIALGQDGPDSREIFNRTRVIGFSQVGQPGGGWFVAEADSNRSRAMIVGNCSGTAAPAWIPITKAGIAR